MTVRFSPLLALGFAAVVALLLPGRVWSQSATTGAEGLDLWDRIHAVFSHPRCANCHVGADGVPLWSGAHYARAGEDAGTVRAHGMNIRGGDSRDGAQTLPCSTCHTDRNASTLHGPPGAPHWALPPVEMQWAGRSSAEICAQIKDPARNGGRTLEQVADHVGHDALVAWGWAPGAGREPAPFSAAEMLGFILAWDALGAPCPPEN